MLLYTQIENGQALYPASGIEFFIDREIITAGASEEDLAQANIVEVTPFTGQAPVDGRQYRVEIVQQSDDSWAHELVEVEISEEQLANNIAQQARAVKADRDRMIASTDWIVTKAAEEGTAVPQAWKTYRQALRDIPEQEGFPFNIIWPTRP